MNQAKANITRFLSVSYQQASVLLGGTGMRSTAITLNAINMNQKRHGLRLLFGSHLVCHMPFKDIFNGEESKNLSLHLD